MYSVEVIAKNVSAITPDDINALVATPRLEDRQLDYKSELPGGTDDDKREFLADVSAFANASGGDLIFGVEESSGVPSHVPGVHVENFDELRLRLQNLIREAIDPVIPQVEIVAVDGFERGPVVIVRVHQSWQAPHMVTYKRWSRFFMRDAGQRHQMDTQELRAAFVAGETLERRIRAFRDERVELVRTGRSPVRLFPHAKFVLHLLPMGPAFASSRLDPRVLRPHVTVLLSNDLVYSGNINFNLDGVLIRSSGNRDDTTDAYIQVFRNGGVEAASTFSVTSEPPSAVYGGLLEKAIVSFSHAVLQFRRAAAIEGPVAGSLALLGVRDLPLIASRPELRRTFDRDVLVLPDVVLPESEPVWRPLRFLLDIVWQAAGYSASPYYQEDGAWKPPVQ
ncbi:MAG: ATP-binding protein [Acidobacteriaceae bacterium]|nr:ATP-binding protein [Acidobacteriaceae bacterium]